MLARAGQRLGLDDHDGLRAYLSFGYLPAVDEAQPLGILRNWSAGALQTNAPAELESAISTGVRVIRGMAEPALSRRRPSRHVVLLSGGFDSRAILGSLLESVDRSNIVACTYGYRGNEEFEIAARVAKLARVEHVRIEIENTRWTTDALVDSVRARPWPPCFVLVARYQNYRIYREFGHDCLFWDGFAGDALTGAHLRGESAAYDWAAALRGFVGSNQAGRKALAPPDFDPLAVLPSQPLCPPEVLGFEDQLDLALRQTCYIGHRLPGDYATATPFTDARSWRFWLGLPRPFRKEQRVYKTALARAYPKLFSIPVAGGRDAAAKSGWRNKASAWNRQASLRIARSFGMRSRFAHVRTNVGPEMRENRSLRNLIGENIADLERRRLIDWLSPAEIWADHLSGRADRADAIRILVSLEIALKVAP